MNQKQSPIDPTRPIWAGVKRSDSYSTFVDYNKVSSVIPVPRFFIEDELQEEVTIVCGHLNIEVEPTESVVPPPMEISFYTKIADFIGRLFRGS